MKASMKIVLGCIATVAIAGGSTWVATAQVPAKPTILRVASKTTTAADTRRPTPKAVLQAAPAVTTEAPRAAGAEVLITRETYAYPGAGRRDPFVSLINTEELRPFLTDLKLVAIAFDPSGRNSVAVLRDVTTKEQYRVKVGQEIGRMRVASIKEKMVIFGIEEFGYSRQESLAISDSTTVRTQ